MLEQTLCHGIHVAIPRIPWNVGVVIGHFQILILVSSSYWEVLIQGWFHRLWQNEGLRSCNSLSKSSNVPSFFFQGKKIGKKKEKNPTKMKARRQDRKTKGEQLEDKTENRGKTTTKCSRRKGKPQTKNRTWHLLTLHISGPPWLFKSYDAAISTRSPWQVFQPFRLQMDNATSYY